MNAVEILVGARKVLENRFCQGHLENNGDFCALGAVNQVADIKQKYHWPLRDGTPVERAVFFLENAATGKIPSIEGVSTPRDYGYETVEINDDGNCDDEPNPDAQENVLRLFDRAISNARRRHLSTTPFKVTP